MQTDCLLLPFFKHYMQSSKLTLTILTTFTNNFYHASLCFRPHLFEVVDDGVVGFLEHIETILNWLNRLI